ncbi:MAG TPA: hypothetical protein PLL20_20640 [Phycisphaerae bacterium]|nr:hypothetical protein [Phycisphaerae bacterium]HRR87140.1 hypothetical protein [Phycisphaerae bacterium]
MRRRKFLLFGLLTALVGLPIIIGASCPPPDDPAFVSIITGPGSTIGQQLPNCERGRVCISILNQTCTDTDVMLYVHDGYDLTGTYVTRRAVECCENQNATEPCPCYRCGSNSGEMQLTPPELFQPQNRYEISTGQVIRTIPGRQDRLSALGGRITISIRCEEVKTIGLEVGLEGELPGLIQERAGPDYRCTRVDLDCAQAYTEDVACGATIQYTIVDRNNCANQNLTVFRIETNVSADCTQVETTDNSSGGGGMSGG